MGFQLPIALADAIKSIQRQELVLPAIQREFVWEEDQIIRLFDSILRGYPIGSFLSWQIAPETAGDFRFYGFMRNYHQRDNPHCPVLDLPTDKGVVAVLDGQQRLTALNIGLRGSFAKRVKGMWWNNPKAFPQKRLYLNVLSLADENELGMVYDFRMLRVPVTQPASGTAYWYPVSRLYEIEDIADLMAEVASHELGNNKTASKMLGDLWKAIHSAGTLYFYQETDQDVEKVLDIFIRVNSGGTPLSYSDLLLSIATAQWAQRDAREAIHSLVDEVNSTGHGFLFSKDVILKSGLVLIGIKDIGFKVRNFNRENMAKLEQQWDAVSNSLRIAVSLLADFGLAEATLTARSVLIPLAYYVHRRGLSQDYRSATSSRSDRQRVRSWVMRSLVKQGVWGSGLDTLLSELRDAIDEHGEDGFPLEQIESRMAARGKGLSFSPEEIDDLLDTKYGSKRAFAILALLFPHVDTRNVHHIDHVYPRSHLTPSRLRNGGIGAEDANRIFDIRDQLPNLQLLMGPENIEKSDQSPYEWAHRQHHGGELEAYMLSNALPSLPQRPDAFQEWFLARREALTARLSAVLGVTSGSFAQAAEVDNE